MGLLRWRQNKPAPIPAPTGALERRHVPRHGGHDKMISHLPASLPLLTPGERNRICQPCGSIPQKETGFAVGEPKKEKGVGSRPRRNNPPDYAVFPYLLGNT